MNLEPIQLLVVVTAGLIFHAFLGASYRRINPAFVLMAVYFVLAPLSSATKIPAAEALKYGRLYMSLLIIVIGVFLTRVARPRPAGAVFLLWSMFYMAVAVYGPNPVNGVTYKGLYVVVVLSGIVAAYGVKSISDLRIGLRVLLVGSAVFALILFTEMLTNPAAVASIGRLTAFGMNPSRIGQECAPMIICGSMVAFYDRSKPWRLFAYGVCAILSLGAISSGSRGGVFEALIGVFACAVPLIRRPFLLGFTVMIVYVVGSIILKAVSPEATQRLQEVSFDTRRGVWDQAWQYFWESPFVGAGWIMDERARAGGGTRNLHSVYMQVLVETGIFGMGVFLATIAFVSLRAFLLYIFARARHANMQYVYFTLGLLAAVLAHCMVESSTIMGSNINALMLPFSIGLVDRMRELLKQEEPVPVKRGRAIAYDNSEEYGYGPEGEGTPHPAS